MPASKCPIHTPCVSAVAGCEDLVPVDEDAVEERSLVVSLWQQKQHKSFVSFLNWQSIML